MTPKAQAVKENYINWTSSKLKNFVHQRTLSTDLKKQSTEKGENIFKAYTQ